MASQTAERPRESSSGSQPPPLAYPRPAPRLATALTIRGIISAMAMPLAVAVAVLVHYFVPNNEPVAATNYYPTLLLVLLGTTLLLALAQLTSPSLRHWIMPKAPLFSAAILLLCAWQVITLKFALLPL